MTSKGRLAAAAGLMALAIQSQPALAQREVVQALPSEGERELGEALNRLARNSQDTGALVDAGEAALKLGDISAAIGFFGRANELSPGNSRVKVGLGRAYTLSRRPVEALRLFAEAERAGVANERMAEERALAFDLVGDAASAQALYRLAIANGAGSETRRRLALNQAISGDRAGFEATLLPLLEAGDIAAFRTRAFGLAILGDAKQAKDIANTVLPSGMGARMAGYFDYMPRLTKAQQAAAGNLGVFPSAANIGTDEAGIAGYSGAPVRIAAAPPPPPPPAATPSPAASDPRERQTRRRPDRTRSRSERGGRIPLRQQTAEQVVVQSAPAPAPVEEPQAAPEPVRQAAPPPPPPPPPPTPPPSPPPPPPPPAPAPASQSALSVTVAQQQAPAPTSAPVVVARTPDPAPVTPPPPVEDPPSVADAFSGFSLQPGTPAPSASGAVDITRIDIPREREEPKPPPPPAHPSRHWVQVATGKDLAALKFDWRRIARKAEGALDGKGPFTVTWGEANRLLAGPYDSPAEAREMVNRLKAMGIDSFPFTSEDGEAIEELD